jgi:hypothetical protein
VQFQWRIGVTAFLSCSPVLARGHFDGALQYKHSVTNLLTLVIECVNDYLIGIKGTYLPFIRLPTRDYFFPFVSDREQFTPNPVLILL